MMLGIVFISQAQVDSTVKKAGNKTADSKYCYVDKKGEKVYVTKSSLKDKPKTWSRFPRHILKSTTDTGAFFIFTR
jgi:hypothetical protein